MLIDDLDALDDLNLDAVVAAGHHPSSFAASNAANADLVAFGLLETGDDDSDVAEAAAASAAIEQQHAAIAAFGSTAAAAAVSLTVTAEDVEAIDALVAEVLHDDGGQNDRSQEDGGHGRHDETLLQSNFDGEDEDVEVDDICGPGRQLYETITHAEDNDVEGAGVEPDDDNSMECDSDDLDMRSDGSSVCNDLSDLNFFERMAELDSCAAPSPSTDYLHLKRTDAEEADDERFVRIDDNECVDKAKASAVGGPKSAFGRSAEHSDIEARIMAAFDSVSDGMRRLECRKYASTAKASDLKTTPVIKEEVNSQDSEDMVLVENEMEQHFRVNCETSIYNSTDITKQI